MALLRVLLVFIVMVVAFSPTKSYAWWFGKNKKPVLIYDIEKNVYDSLTEEQRKNIIEVYKGHEAIKEKYKGKIADLNKQIDGLVTENQQIGVLEKEKEGLQSEISKLKLQIKAQEKALSNFLSVSQDLLEARSKGKNYKEKQKREKFFPKIVNIHRGFNSTTVKLENDTLIEISPFEKEKIETWMNGHSVELSKGEGLVYILQLTNLDTENSVSAKIKEAP